MAHMMAEAVDAVARANTDITMSTGVDASESAEEQTKADAKAVDDFAADSASALGLASPLSPSAKKKRTQHDDDDGDGEDDVQSSANKKNKKKKKSEDAEEKCKCS